MNNIGGQFTSIEQITGQYFSAKSVNNSKANTDISFEDVLNQKKAQLEESDSSVRFSKHASMRLQDRNINLTDAQNVRLQHGVEQADKKGIQESLVLIDSLAFIVNVPCRTVVTAMDQTDTTENVFTNIDGAVIM